MNEQTAPACSQRELAVVCDQIRIRGVRLGFQQIGFTGINLAEDEAHLRTWLDRRRHGEMAYMARHGYKRSRPAALIAGTRSVVTARMDYWPAGSESAAQVLANSRLAYISRYALGRDYHKLMRRRLKQLAQYARQLLGKFGYRVFTDSAPVLEKALARNSGLGWIGKHTNLINPRAGSWFFIGEIYTDLPLPPDPRFNSEHCGTCTRCLEACPTNAIVAPYQLDARLCISYLTIELHGSIPLALRPLIGNRIYGCDDCQLVCPWNKYARLSAEEDFRARHGLDAASLVTLFRWSKTEFKHYTEGSAIRRLGYRRWLRNLAVALGNSAGSAAVTEALAQRRLDSDPIVQEHVQWALNQHNR